MAYDWLVEQSICKKPNDLINKWKDQFNKLDQLNDENKSNLAAMLQIEIKPEPMLENAWEIVDKFTNQRYWIAKQTTTASIDRMTLFIAKYATLKVAVSLSLLNEGPIGQAGVNQFDNYIYWPLGNTVRGYEMHPPASSKANAKFQLLAETSKVKDEVIYTAIRALIIYDFEEPRQLNQQRSTTTGTGTGTGSISKSGSELTEFDLESMINEKTMIFSLMINHVQQLNWPPNGYPPMCTLSVLRTVTYVLQVTATKKDEPSDALITCSNGTERSAAFVIVCLCYKRLVASTPVIRQNCVLDIVFHVVSAFRGRCPQSIRRLGTFLWLNYAVLEFCCAYMEEIDQLQGQARKWLKKLKEGVIQIAREAL